MSSLNTFRILVDGWGEGYPVRSGDLVIARDRVIGARASALSRVVKVRAIDLIAKP
jgi:hypothetical protein